MKKFFYLLFSIVFFAFFTFSVTGCSKNEVDKVSKNLTSYAISAEFDEDTKQIVASETVVFYNNTGTELSYVCFHLYPRAFREGATIKPYTTLTEATCFPNGISFGDLVVVKVRIKGEEKPWELVGEDEDILKIDFGFNLTEKKTIEITIDFILTIPNSTHRLGWYNGNVNLGNWYPILCAYTSDGYDLSPYYATGDPFFSEIANYEVTFTYPASFSLCSTGEKITQNNGEKLCTKITAKAVRDFAMCLSNECNIVSKTVGDTTIFYMGYKADKEFDKYLNISVDAVNWFSDNFGEYPYSTLTVAKTPFIYGGMEYPNLVFVSDSIDDEEEYLKVIVHEIAHQWWYAVVGNNERSEAWLDESLSEYSTALFFDKHSQYGISYDEFVTNALSSYLLYVDVIQTIRGEVNTQMNLAVNEYQNDYEYSYMVYVKGVIMFDSLKNMVGEKKVIAGLKEYYKNNKFKIATKDDFLKSFKDACHKDLDTFFDGYLNGTTIISSIN